MTEQELKQVLYHTQGWDSTLIDLNDPVLREYIYYNNKNKSWIRNTLFGDNNYIYDAGEVSIALDVTIKEKLFNNFKEEIRETNLRRYLDTLTPEDFFSNMDQNNQKVSRSFKNYIANKDELRQLQDAASRLMQQDRIFGHLTFSVDPQDYLTMSMNAENWQSCQRLWGDYRCAALSYMQDDCTIVVSLHNNSYEHTIPWYPLKWNSKKWRMLIHVKPNGVVYLGKQYPFECDQLKYKVITIIHELLDPKNSDYARYRSPEGYNIGYKFLISDSKNNIQDNDPRIHYTDTIFKVSEFTRPWKVVDIIDFNGYVGFNDITSSSNYSLQVTYPWYLVNSLHKEDFMTEYQQTKSIFGMKIGHSVKCPVCGKHMIRDESRFMCEECLEYYGCDDSFDVCYECGKRLSDGEAHKNDLASYCKKCASAFADELKQEEKE